MKTKIFVSAYACEPNLGSEIGVGWHWVLEMSKQFELWVLTRESNKKNIEKWIKENKSSNPIHFIYYDLPKPLRFWKKGLRGVRTYYTIWQKTTNRIVRKTMKENNIEIYHLLTYGNSLWPASRYGKKQFFVWGPTGGVDYVSRSFTKYYGLKGKLTQGLRRAIIRTLKLNAGFISRCKNANLILCKSDSMYEAVPKKYRNKAKEFTDCAVDETLIGKYDTCNNEKIVYTTVGRLDAWRNFDVLVEAFSQLYKKHKNIVLNIVGDGNDHDRIEKLIGIRDMSEIINMTGQVTMDEYKDIMKKTDVVVNPTYKEGAVTMSFDAMAMGKPLICIETGGYTKYFSKDNAIILKKDKRENLIDEMVKAMEKMLDEGLRKKLGDNALKVARKNTWEEKGKEICKEITLSYGRR